MFLFFLRFTPSVGGSAKHSRPVRLIPLEVKWLERLLGLHPPVARPRAAGKEDFHMGEVSGGWGWAMRSTTTSKASLSYPGSNMEVEFNPL